MQENDKSQSSSPAMGPEQIEQAEKEKEVQALLELADKKGVTHTLEVAKKLKDLYVLGRFFEEMGRILRDREWKDINKE